MRKDHDIVRCLTIVFDSIKQMAQMERGYNEGKDYITSIEQTMPSGTSWNEFLCNPENKTMLISTLVAYYKSPIVQKTLPFPLIVTEETQTWGITRNDVVEMLPCNHIEADTRLILEASKSDLPVVIKATDTDILVLMCYAHSKMNFSNDWLMEIDDNTYLSVKTIREYFGDEFCLILPAYHSITGCDTTSFPANIGKIRTLTKMLKSK